MKRKTPFDWIPFIGLFIFWSWFYKEDHDRYDSDYMTLHAAYTAMYMVILMLLLIK
jgi:hypothetical protein